MSYDAAGNMLTRTESGFTGTTAITMTTTYTYDSYGRVTSMNGPRTDVNDVITMSYYPNEADQGSNRGFLHTVTNALGHVVTYSSYNGFGQAEQITDANGLTTSLAYNTQGLVVTRTTGDLTTSYDYDSTGTLQSVALPGARIINYQYNTAGQIASITDSQGNAITYTYDSEGRRTGEDIRDPENTLTRFVGFVYDARGNLEQVTLPGNAVQTAEYDLVGNLVKTVNATGMQTNSTYDALGRLLTLTEAGVVAGSYTYDGHGNVSQVQDADNKASQFVYDDLGRRVLATAPDTGQSSSGYDAAGNLLTVTDARGQTVNRTYDALNRPLSQSSAGGEVLFTYDQGANAIGRLTRIVDGEGTASFAYDEAGRLISETRVIGSSSYTIGYSYNAATGELQTMTYPSGLVVGYSRDGSGRISGMSLDGAPLVSGVSHLPFGPLTSASLGSVNLTKTYDQRYNISRIKAAGLDLIYTRDAEGHVSGISGITAPTTSGTSTDYSYDPANNQLTAAPPKSYSYDATGNMVSDGTSTFTWDGLNRLIKVEEAGATVAEYGYDAANRRIRKTVGAATTHYLYDLNNQLIAEAQADGTVLREYIYLDGEPMALKEYQSNPGVYYYINDHLGTPQQLVSATGTVVWQAAYLPFGQAQIKTATVTNNLRFPGQYFDAETGLHYNWHRYYDPDTGRYVSADPIGLKGGMNLYLYVQNNPVNWVDPRGLWPSEWPKLPPQKPPWYNDPNHWTQGSVNLGEVLGGTTCVSVCMTPYLVGYGNNEAQEGMIISMIQTAANRYPATAPFVLGGSLAYSYWDSSGDAQDIFNMLRKCIRKCSCE